MSYYTLIERAEDSFWYPQFGDHSKQCVEDERDSMVGSWIANKRTRAADLKIIRTRTARQGEISDAIATLNAGEQLRRKQLAALAAKGNE